MRPGRPPIRARLRTIVTSSRRAAARGAAALLAATLFATLAATGAAAQTILNVERLQPGDVTRWHWGVEGSVSLSTGNSEYTDLLAGVVAGYRWPRDWLRVFAGLDYRDETGESLENDRYLHTRYNHWWADRWQTFHFIQFQTSRRNLLQQRVLLGSGVRHRLIDGRTTFDMGTGAMFEREDLDATRIEDDHPADTRVWRMANLLVATRSLTEAVRLIGVTYIQPDLSNFQDIRILADLSLLIEITENVDLVIRGDWRHDSRPPGGVGRDDFVLRTGFTVSFR